MTKIIKIILIIFSLCSIAFGCHSKSGEYTWSEVTSNAGYPKGYNYPVFVMNGEMRALKDGGWISKDGKNWTNTGLPNIGLNSAYQRFVLFKDAVYALGTMRGNYLNMQLSSKISRSRDFKIWETLAEKSNLPDRVFYGALVFKDKIWLFGGWDGTRYYNDVWSSADGVKWTRVVERTNWTPRNPGVMTVFKDRIWLFGGSVIDGEKSNNPNSGKEVWSSGDGVNWTQVAINAPRQPGGTPIVFDNKLWMVGANRNKGYFGSTVFVSEDGVNWQEQFAPWSPRVAVAVWVYDNKLFMTGGKYSYTEPNGEIKFVYNNDVWMMSKKTE